MTSKVTEVLKRVDWTLLQAQKLAILEMAHSTGPDNADSLIGLVHFLDALQDAAVKEGIADESEVFPTNA